MKKHSLFLSFAIISLVLSGCGPGKGLSLIEPAKPTTTITLTATITPTSTLTPTSTSTSTPTITPTPSHTPNPYDAGNGMILIPEGEFLMGCDPEHNGGLDCQSGLWVNVPLHAVYLDAYLIDKYEVTNAQYAECVASGHCEESIYQYYENKSLANFPVIGIEFANAEAYCSWAGKRLPTEAEWEKAARGTSPRAYPWGDAAPNCTLANFNNWEGESCETDSGPLHEVGSYPEGVSPYGVHDMAGNVYEWVSDYYSDTYYDWSPYENPQGPTADQAYKFSWLACPTCIYLEHVLRGGSYWGGSNITTSSRFIQMQGPFEEFGIRCAMDVD